MLLSKRRSIGSVVYALRHPCDTMPPPLRYAVSFDARLVVGGRKQFLVSTFSIASAYLSTRALFPEELEKNTHSLCRALPLPLHTERRQRKTRARHEVGTQQLKWLHIAHGSAFRRSFEPAVSGRVRLLSPKGTEGAGKKLEQCQEHSTSNSGACMRAPCCRRCDVEGVM